MLESILTVLNIVKAGMDIIERLRGGRTGQPTVGPAAVTAFRETVQARQGPVVAQRLQNDARLQQGLQLMAHALADWQASSTPLCPLLLRKTTLGDEANLGFMPAEEDGRAIEGAYAEWKAWLEKGPIRNKGLLVFMLESPSRETVVAIRAMNERRTGLHHIPQYGCLDVRSGTFYGPPPDFMEQYLQAFQVDTFWNGLLKSMGYFIA